MTFATLRRTEFARLDVERHAYLDYTGSALYATSHVRRHLHFLEHAVLGNPHSENPASARSTAIVEDARCRVLDFFHAAHDEWVVCFTANASAAIKLVAESFPFTAGSRLVLTADNHNSVGGLRCYAERARADVRYAPLDDELRVPALDHALAGARTDAPNLLAYPAQSNFSGVKHPLDWIAAAHAHGYDVLLDAAAFAPTSPLPLDRVRPDFVALSFYKMFGYPTGVGALIARKASLARLHRPWFAGGTVDFVSNQHRMHRFRGGAEAFEDGTPSFLDIAALPAGLDVLDRIGMTCITARVERLTALLLERLASLRHVDGASAVRFHGPADSRDRGGTVAFNVLDAAGDVVPYWVVEERAARARVSVRGGCFCNPGAAEAAFHFPPDHTLACLRETGDAFTIPRFAACLAGVPVGAVRASVGIATMPRDIERLIRVIARVAGVRHRQPNPMLRR